MIFQSDLKVHDNALTATAGYQDLLVFMKKHSFNLQDLALYWCSGDEAYTLFSDSKVIDVENEDDLSLVEDELNDLIDFFVLSFREKYGFDIIPVEVPSNSEGIDTSFWSIVEKRKEYEDIATRINWALYE